MKVAYDTKLMRPGCVLVAAMMGADTFPCHKFDVHDWLLYPTADMAVYETTKEQLSRLVLMTENARKKAAEAAS